MSVSQLLCIELPVQSSLLLTIHQRCYVNYVLCPFQFVLQVLGTAVSVPGLQSAATQIERVASTGQSEYETDPAEYPLNQPVDKLEGQSQCTGEAKFADDNPVLPGELFAAYVQAKVGNCDLQSVNTAPALVHLQKSF